MAICSSILVLGVAKSQTQLQGEKKKKATGHGITS